jgi:hypothetical protein
MQQGFKEAIENQKNKEYIATADYFCRIEGCSKFGKKIPKGKSHSHFSTKKLTRRELELREKRAAIQRERSRKLSWSRRQD